MVDAITAYSRLTETFVICAGGRYEVSSPQETEVFGSKESLLDYIHENLEIMEELVKDGQIEKEIWDEAWR